MNGYKVHVVKGDPHGRGNGRLESELEGIRGADGQTYPIDLLCHHDLRDWSIAVEGRIVGGLQCRGFVCGLHRRNTGVIGGSRGWCSGGWTGGCGGRRVYHHRSKLYTSRIGRITAITRGVGHGVALDGAVMVDGIGRAVDGGLAHWHRPVERVRRLVL